METLIAVFLSWGRMYLGTVGKISASKYGFSQFVAKVLPNNQVQSPFLYP